MNFADFMLPWIIHPAGHLSYGNQAANGAHVDYGSMTEKWDMPVRAWRHSTEGDITENNYRVDPDQGYVTPIYDENVQSQFGGSGFKAQDDLARAKKSPSYSLGNAMHKALYFAGAHRFAGANTEGDINQMSHNSGAPKGIINAMLGATVASDLYHYANPDSNARLSFNVMNGTPGVMFNVPLDADMKPVWKSSKNAMR